MALRRGFAALLSMAALGAFAAACKQDGRTQQCMNMGGASSIVTSAAALRVQVFDGSVACPATSGGKALSDKTFAKGEAITLDVKPGNRTIVLIAYSDSAATTVIGRACTTATLGKGDEICLDITVEPVTPPDLTGVDAALDGGGDGGVLDQAMPDGNEIDQAMPDDLTVREDFAVPEDFTVLPDLVVPADLKPECTSAADTCGTGKLCCNGHCIDESITNCGDCGKTCSTEHGTPTCDNGTCKIACDTGYQDCDATVGCETNINESTAHCGACNRACSTTQTMGALDCNAGLCVPTCNAGRVSCSNPAAPTADNGCECEGDACCGSGCQGKHSTGVNYDNNGAYEWFDCTARDAYSLALAQAACARFPSSGATAGSCSTKTCMGDASSGVVCWVKPDTMSGGNNGRCACWQYASSDGNLVGRVNYNPNSDACFCAANNSPQWH